MTPAQTETAQIYASIPLATRVHILNDLAEWSRSESDPMVRAGIMLAATRIVSQATRLEREKRRRA